MPIFDPFKQQPAEGNIPNIVIEGGATPQEQPPKEQSTFDKYLGIGSPVQRVVAGAINEPLMALGQMVIDPFTNLADVVAKKAFDKDLGLGKPVTEYAQRIAQMEQERRAAEGDTGIDIYKLGGAVASPLNYIAGTQVAKAGMTGMKAAATTGGITGALAAPTLEEDMPMGKLKQAGIGTGAGVAGNLIGQGVGRVLSPKVSTEEQLLRDLGVTPTTGETAGGLFGEIEKTLAGIPVLKKLVTPAQQRSIDSFNIGILNKPLKEAGIDPIEAGLVGQKAMKVADQRMSAAYDEVLGKMDFTLDPTTVQNLATARASKTLTSGQQRVVDRKIAEILGTKVKPGQTIDGATMKEIESAFKKEVERFDKSTLPGQNDIGDAIDNVFGAFKNSIKSQNPDYAAQLNTLDKSFAQLETLRLAVNKADGGVFTPAQLLASVKEAAKTRIGKKYTSYGEAFLQPEAQAAQKVLGQGAESGDWGKVGLLGAVYAAGQNIPAAIGVSVGTGVLYTKLGQKVADTLLRARPEEAKLIGAAIEKAGTVTPAIAAQISRVIRESKIEVAPQQPQNIEVFDPFKKQQSVQPQSKTEAVNVIAKAAQDKGTQHLTGLLTGIAKVESNFDPNAKSKVSSAKGMFQFVNKTAKQYNLADPYDAYASAGAAASYLDMLMKRYKGDKVKALAAYNQGEGTIDRGLNKAGRDYAMKVLAASRNI